MSLAGLARAAGTTVGHWARLAVDRPPIVFLNQRWAHHGRHSGYLIDESLGPNLARDDRFLPHPLVDRWRARTGDHYVEDRWLLWASLAAAGARLLHMVDGDFDTWAYQRRPPLLRTRLTATFHQPVDRLRPLVAALRPGLLDGIVCVSRDQIPALAPLVPPGRCVFIPHGVDTAFFTPAAGQPAGAGADTETGPPVLLTVGSHRRDFPTLVEAARIVKGRRPDAVVRLIAAADKVGWVTEHGAGLVEVRSGVSDQALRDEYRRAALVLLPLEVTTANNALLEAMACGTPVVVTDLPAIRDYAAPDSVALCAPGDAPTHATAALAVLDDADRRRAMSRAGQAQAQALTWPLIRAQTADFLRSVIGAG